MTTVPIELVADKQVQAEMMQKAGHCIFRLSTFV